MIARAPLIDTVTLCSAAQPRHLFSSSEAGTEQRRKALGDNYDNKGDDEQKRDELILEQTHRREQFEADAAGADKAEHQRRADVLVEPIEGDPEERGQNRWDDAVR